MVERHHAEILVPSHPVTAMETSKNCRECKHANAINRATIASQLNNKKEE